MMRLFRVFGERRVQIFFFTSKDVSISGLVERKVQIFFGHSSHLNFFPDVKSFISNLSKMNPDDAPRWSSVFRRWVHAPPNGWPTVSSSFLDVVLDDILIVEDLMQAPVDAFDIVLESLTL